MKLVRTNGADADFRQLVFLLDEGLKITDGDEFSFFAQYNKSEDIQNVIVAYHDGIAAGCGAFKDYADGVAEIKRMYVREELRGKGVASAVLGGLEDWARELGFKSSILETGCMLTAAISLYEKSGYRHIPNYGQYENVETSVCMEKDL
jgi:putative acetyltransferase